jgi:hypothetical protein
MKRRHQVAIGVGGVVVVVALVALRSRASGGPAPEWAGVDDSVIGRFVAEAGRPEPRPLFPWLQGDLLLFAFLWAGLIAGFVLGYWGRALFGEAGRDAQKAERDV